MPCYRFLISFIFFSLLADKTKKTKRVTQVAAKENSGKKFNAAFHYFICIFLFLKHEVILLCHVIASLIPLFFLFFNR
jgi:hypothetical protein